METLLVAIDLLGTFVFALSGALVGVRHRLDLFGVQVRPQPLTRVTSARCEAR
jgi:uncharacterized membrane protein YeiH